MQANDNLWVETYVAWVMLDELYDYWFQLDKHCIQHDGKITLFLKVLRQTVSLMNKYYLRPRWKVDFDRDGIMKVNFDVKEDVLK